MSLEQALAANTEALNALTAALLANGSASAASTKTEKPAAAAETKKTTAAGKGKASKPTHTPEECQAVLIKIKDEFDLAHAKSVLAEHGIDKMANITAAQADAVFASAEAKYAELSGAAGGEDAGDDGL